MLNDLISFVVLYNLLLFATVKGENYDDKTGDSKDDDEGSQLESESNEVYNISSKEKPVRVKDTRNNINGNISIDIVSECKDSGPTTPKEIKNRNYKTSYPYAVSIQKKGSHYASGALISDKWIITVAGEFYYIRESIKLFRARLGSVNCKKGGKLVPLKKIEIHPSYIYKQPRFDLAMLRIAQSLEFSEFIKPIQLSNIKGQVVGAKFLTIYWPRLIINGRVLSQTANERLKHKSMRVSTQILIPWEKCQGILQSYNYSLDMSSLCLEPLISHHSPCTPDAGAPVIADDGLWGITSGWTSEECTTHLSPTIFTRISLARVRSWIDSLL